VTIKVPACVDLAKKQGTCDPFVICTANYSNKQQVTRRTKQRKKTVDPEFDEAMYFDLHIDAEAGSTNTTTSNKSTGSLESSANKGYAIYPLGGADLVEIVVSIWHDAHGAMSDKVFLGEVRLPMLNKQEQQAVSPSAWYYLQPRSMTHSCRSVEYFHLKINGRGTMLISPKAGGILAKRGAYPDNFVCRFQGTSVFK